MVTAYLHERFQLRIFGPAALGIVVAAGWAGTVAITPGTLAVATACSVLLLLQFRLWDDLEDRARDAVTHPERLLVRTPAAPYRCALTGLALANVALCGMGGWPAVAEIVVLNLIFCVAYRRTRRHVPDGLWRFSILLFKYPAFVVVVATIPGAPQPGRVVVAALVAYSTACAYEAWHGNRRLATYHRVVMKRGSPRTMKTCLPTRCRGGPAGPPRADAWVGPYLSFSEQDAEDAEVEP